MVSEKEIYQAAMVLIRQHGADAEHVAAGRADKLLDEGDIDGESTLLKIIAAIRTLSTTTTEETLH